MTLRTLVCAAFAFLGAAIPVAAGAQTASAIKFAPQNGDGSVSGSSAVVVTCEALKSGMLGRVPTTGTLTVTDGSFAGEQPSVPLAFSLVSGSTYAASATWATPAAGSPTVTCSVDTASSPSVLTRTVAVAAPPAGAPVIATLDVPSGNVFVGEQVTLRAEAIDPEGRPLTYAWTVSGGSVEGGGTSATWTTPSTAGTYLVQVTATNDAGVGATKSAAVGVLFSAYRDALPARMTGPRDVSAAPGGELFVVDGQGRLHRLTRRGDLVATSLGSVTGVAAAEGVVFAAVPDAILKLDPFTGRLLGRIELGSQPPVALAYDAARMILWMVNPSGAVEGIRPDGTPVLTIPVRFPRDVAVDAAGLVWVVLEKNEGGNMVQAFDPTTGARVRDIVPSGQGAGMVAVGGGIAVDGSNRIFVSDFFSGTVQVVAPTGALLASLGSYGSAPGSLLQPAGLAFMANGDLAVANMDLGRIDRFGTKLPLPVCTGDADCDGLPDAWESANGLDPNDASDALADLDGDGLNNAEELVHGTKAGVVDSDGDGYSDAEELASGFDPTNPDDHRPRVVISAPASTDPGFVRMSAVVSDPASEGGACSLQWAQAGGASVALQGATTTGPSFVARRAGAYRFRAVATCGGTASLPAQVEIAVNNLAPVADGGRLLAVEAGGRVTMSGEFSTDANADALSFVWDQLLGAPVIESVANKAFATRFRDPGYYVFRLGATDPSGAEGETEVPVLVVGDVPPPAAVVTTPVTAEVGNLVTLDASGSYAAEGATFIWEQTAGAPVALGGDSTPAPSFTAPAAGLYAFRVSIVEAGLRSPPASVDVRVAEPGFSLPVAQIAFPGVAAVNAPVILDGGASVAGTGGPLGYRWRQVAGPSAGLTDAAAAAATAVAFVPGSYEFELVVSDGAAVSHPARVRFEARAGGKPIPVAAASAPATATAGDLVLLNGQASTGAARFRWTQVDGPWVPVHQGPVAHFRPVAPGLYGFELEVDDGAVRSAPVRVNVMVFADPAGGQ